MKNKMHFYVINASYKQNSIIFFSLENLNYSSLSSAFVRYSNVNEKNAIDFST